MKLSMIVKIVLLVTSLITLSHSASTQQDCDSEKKTCCAAADMGTIPPIWVNASSCPKGMVDNATCVIQYGCKKSSSS